MAAWGTKTQAAGRGHCSFHENSAVLQELKRVAQTAASIETEQPCERAGECRSVANPATDPRLLVKASSNGAWATGRLSDSPQFVKSAVPTGRASRMARLTTWRASLLIRLAVSSDHAGLAHRLGRFRSRRRLGVTPDGD